MEGMGEKERIGKCDAEKRREHVDSLVFMGLLGTKHLI
jgi:hypothetical protein